MTIAEKMIAHREELGLSQPEMAKRIDISTRLLQILEDGGYTMPGIIHDKIMPEYGFTPAEGELLLPENMRPHGNDYDPYRYFNPEDLRSWHTRISLYHKTDGKVANWIKAYQDIKARIETYFGKPERDEFDASVYTKLSIAVVDQPALDRVCSECTEYSTGAYRDRSDYEERSTAEGLLRRTEGYVRSRSLGGIY